MLAVQVVCVSQCINCLRGGRGDNGRGNNSGGTLSTRASFSKTDRANRRRRSFGDFQRF